MSRAYLLRLALRNTLRNRRRSLLTLVAIFLGVAIFVFAQSLVAGIERTMVGTEIDSEQAHLRVMARAFADQQEFFPLDAPLTSVADVEVMVRQLHPDARTARRVAFSAQLGDPRRSLSCRGLVIDPDRYGGVMRLGSLPAPPGQPGHHLWLGADIAHAFGVDAGGTLTVQAKTRHGTRNALAEVRIAGVISTGHPLVDNFTVFLPPQSGAELLDLDAGYATELLVRLPNAADAEALARAIEARWPALVAETWQRKTEYIVRFNNIRRAVFNVFTVVVLLMAGAGVANTVLMSGYERVTEIGALLALGLSRGRVMALFLLESLLLGGCGVAAGLIAGGLPAAYLERHGVPFPAVKEQAGTSLPLPPMLYLDLTTNTLTLAIALGLCITLVAAAYPAWRLAHTDPVWALKAET